VVAVGSNHGHHQISVTLGAPEEQAIALLVGLACSVGNGAGSNEKIAAYRRRRERNVGSSGIGPGRK